MLRMTETFLKNQLVNCFVPQAKILTKSINTFVNMTNQFISLNFSQIRWDGIIMRDFDIHRIFMNTQLAIEKCSIHVHVVDSQELRQGPHEKMLL